jgi:hypothetical protein
MRRTVPGRTCLLLYEVFQFINERRTRQLGQTRVVSAYAQKRRSPVRPSLTYSPRMPLTTISIRPWANSSPTGIRRPRSSIKSICTAWTAFRGWD